MRIISNGSYDYCKATRAYLPWSRRLADVHMLMSCAANPASPPYKADLLVRTANRLIWRSGVASHDISMHTRRDGT
jgi:hypothetical protein